MPIPHFLPSDLLEGLAEVFVRRRRAICFLEFILQHWNPSKGKEINKQRVLQNDRERKCFSITSICTVKFKLLFCQSSIGAWMWSGEERRGQKNLEFSVCFILKGKRRDTGH